MTRPADTDLKVGQSGLDFGRLYKELRYPWLHV